jgi:hypothetical protein
MEINIDDCLTEEQKREIVIEQYRLAVAANMKTEKDIQRILSNAGFNAVYSIIDECFDGSSKEIIRTKINEILNDLSSYNIFNKPDAWSRETNSAYDYLQQCIEENKDVIRDKVVQLLDEQTARACKQDVKELVACAINEYIDSL